MPILGTNALQRAGRTRFAATRYMLDQNVRHSVVTVEHNNRVGNANANGNGNDHRMDNDKQLALTVAENLVIGIISSLVGATLTHPADVVKTRMMTQAASKALPYSSTMDCVKTIWNTEGIRAFYSGFVQRSVYMGPLWSIQFALNGKITAFLQNQNLRNADGIND